jgi:hypothetical protein
MDILHLVDRLEEVFNAGRPIPFTRGLLVDENRILEIIDQMRVSIPEEVKKAQQVLAQRDRILAQAQEEAARTVQLAKEKGEQLVSQEALTAQAQVRGEKLLQEARAEAMKIRAEADDYSLDVLMRLEGEAMKSLNQIRNGINKLRTEKGLPPQQ